MTITCARCGAEVGDAAACARCGTRVLSPQSVDQSIDQSIDQSNNPSGDRSSGDEPSFDWHSDTAERPAVRLPVEPAPASGLPTPPRFPLYADQAEESVSAHVEPTVAPTPPPYSPDDPEHLDEDDQDGGAPPWLPWVILALLMLLVAVGGVWLLLSPGDDDTASDPAPAVTASPKIDANQSPTPSTSPPSTEAEDASPSDSAPAGDPVDVAAGATAVAPRTAPPNVDAFGNRTTYAASNMLDGRPSTCWRMAGDGSGAELTFTLSGPATLTRVGLINGYAKNALVGGRNLNWYVGNRRVLSAQWVFDDGTTVDQPLGSTKKMQTIDLGTPVSTSTVTLRLVSVSAPGSGRSARDFTAVSEVSLVGTPEA
jgi:hypothetical protein